MDLSLIKAVPVVRRHDRCVVGWICTIHATFDGGTGFDDLKFQVPPREHRPLSEWTTTQLREFLERECPTHHSFLRFVGHMNFRRDFSVESECALSQLGDESHVKLTCAQLSQ